jgi:hypothetical protein
MERTAPGMLMIMITLWLSLCIVELVLLLYETTQLCTLCKGKRKRSSVLVTETARPLQVPLDSFVNLCITRSHKRSKMTRSY